VSHEGREGQIFPLRICPPKDGLRGLSVAFLYQDLVTPATEIGGPCPEAYATVRGLMDSMSSRIASVASHRSTARWALSQNSGSSGRGALGATGLCLAFQHWFLARSSGGAPGAQYQTRLRFSTVSPESFAAAEQERQAAAAARGKEQATP
jgi:hypothetical protein